MWEGVIVSEKGWGKERVVVEGKGKGWKGRGKEGGGDVLHG